MTDTFDEVLSALAAASEGTDESADSLAVQARACRELSEISSELSMQTVARRFGMMLSGCPCTQTVLALRWIDPLVCRDDVPVSAELSAIFTRIALAPLNFEVRTENGERVHATIELFGKTLPLPFDLLVGNYVAGACILRMLGQGHVAAAKDARPAFTSVARIAGSGSVDYTNFRFGAALDASLSRASFVCAIATAFVASVLCAVAEKSPADARLYIEMSRTVLLDVLRKLSIDVRAAVDAGRAKWIGDLDFEMIDRLVDLCSESANFHSRAFVGVLLMHYRAIMTHWSSTRNNAARDAAAEAMRTGAEAARRTAALRALGEQASDAAAVKRRAKRPRPPADATTNET